MPTQFGNYLKAKRLSAALSLRELAQLLGVSHVFIGEVERGTRQLAENRWSDLVAALPGTSLAELRSAAAADLPLKKKLENAPPDYQHLMHALARSLDSGKRFEQDELKKLIKMLGGHAK